MKNRFFPFTLAILGLFVTSYVRAADAPQGGVARLSVIRGDVSTMRGDSGQWVAGTVNTPLVPGDKVATADRARAEVQLDFANIMRLDQRTEAKIADLSPNKIQIQLASGLVDYSIFKGTEADAEIDTPNMGVHPLTDGIYRVQVNSPGDTQLTVLQGEAEVLTNEGSTKVQTGEIIFIHGTDNPEYRIDQAPSLDDFDKWSMDRDRQISSAQARQRTSPYYTGSSDLDTYGQWEEVPDYGWCWTPMVDMGWVPYRYGRWVWEPYWGWTWASYEPWGWAPYHYGRWFFYGSQWRWWPGVGLWGPRPAWGPAYVSFFGFGGGGFGFGFGFGSIGWLPLGPRDIFHPWWGAGHSFNVANFNAFHGPGFTTPGGRAFGSNLEGMMSNARVRGALTHVSSEDFVSGRMRNVPVSEGMLRGASMVRGTLPVVPTQASLGNRAGNFAGFRSEASTGDHFFSRGATSVGRAGNFSAEAGEIREMMQRGPAPVGTGRGPSSEAQTSGRISGNAEAFGARANGMAAGRAETEAGRQQGLGSSNPPAQAGNWSRFASGNQAGRWPAAVNGPNYGGQVRNSPAPQGNQGSWRGFTSQPAPSGGRSEYAQPRAGQGGWQGYYSQPRSYSGGGYSGGSNEPRGAGGWNQPAPRSSGSYGGSRPPLELNRPIMRQRSNEGSYSGGRSYSAPSGRAGGSSAPHGGGGSHGGGRR
jgi:hypothetical protein